MAYTQILYHIVLRTKRNEKSIAKCIFIIFGASLKTRKGNYIELMALKTIFIFFPILHPAFALADFVKSIKVATSLWLKQSPDFPEFKGWGEGYAAFTYSYKEKAVLINYIKKQQIHHKNEDTYNELLRIWKENGMNPDMRYFT
jgi:REP element-mobilizing transposase RayT